MKTARQNWTLLVFGLLCGLGWATRASAIDVTTKGHFWGRVTTEQGMPLKGVTGTMSVIARYADDRKPMHLSEVKEIEGEVTTDEKGEYRFTGNFHCRQADKLFDGSKNKVVEFVVAFKVEGHWFVGDTDTFGAKLLSEEWNLLDLNYRSYEQWANSTIVVYSHDVSPTGHLGMSWPKVPGDENPEESSAASIEALLKLFPANTLKFAAIDSQFMDIKEVTPKPASPPAAHPAHSRTTAAN